MNDRADTITHSQTTDQVTGRTRCIALFPGAFQPPHLAHDTAVRNLAARDDIDEVVVVITNRHRPIPGTSLALGPDVAQRVWSIYLAGVPKVRIEMATGSAVQHALSYFDRVTKSDRLLFCVGESDLGGGGNRFDKVAALSQQTGITAAVITAPTAPLPGRATGVRAHLAQGDDGHDAFMEALPTRLTLQDRHEVWEVCRQGMRDITTQSIRSLHTVIAQSGLGEIDELTGTMNGKPDEVYRLRLKDGRVLYVKYAFDTVKSASLDKPGSVKPRKRLWAEQRAIRWLQNQDVHGIEIPRVTHFDKKIRTLVLSPVCAGGRKLEDDLRRGIFDPAVAKRAARFLTTCHTSTKPLRPLWGDRHADLNHWQTMLELRTAALRSDILPLSTRGCLQALKHASLKATQDCFVHLDYQPKNLLLRGNGFDHDRLGVIDFEFSSSVGDPAFDIGGFVGHYIFWGFLTTRRDACERAAREAMDEYARPRSEKWGPMRKRALAFAGASILYQIVKNNLWANTRPFINPLLTMACDLVAEGNDQSAHQSPGTRRSSAQ